MAENKKSFVLYCDLIHVVEKLSNEQAGILFYNILRYVNGLEVCIEDKEVELICISVIKQIEFEWSKYNPKTNKYHWNYKGGITPENKMIRNSTKMNIWRTDVFNRDNYTCVECGKIGGELNAHHIKMFSTHPELRFDISNGITLCKSCHNIKHKKTSL